MGGLGMAATSAMAADVVNGKSTTTTMRMMTTNSNTNTKTTSSSNLTGMSSGVSKRVGGLANKIRGICLYMVRLGLGLEL